MTGNGSGSLPFESPEQENIRLQEENARLRRLLAVHCIPIPQLEPEDPPPTQTVETTLPVDKEERARKRVTLFRSLFRGREDVHARRWESDDGRSGYSNDGYIHQKYPELCRAIGDKIALAKQAESPTIRRTLENAIEEQPAPTLKDVSRRLGYSSSSVLRAHAPELCDHLAARHRGHVLERRTDLENMVAAALGETPVPSVQALCKRLGISAWFMNQYFPAVRSVVAERHRQGVSAETRRKRERLYRDVHRIATELQGQSLYPSANRIVEHHPEGSSREWTALNLAIREAHKALGISKERFKTHRQARAVVARINHNLAERRSYALDHMCLALAALEVLVRPAGKMKLGYFPLPCREAERIRPFLAFPSSAACSALDPCIGDGGAFAIIAEPARRYGIELDAHRAEQARCVTHELIQGNAFDAYSPVESYSLLYLNPPYDFERGDGRNRRMEQVFLEHFYRWLMPGGVLVLVVPGDRLYVCDEVLATHFKNKRAYRLTEDDSRKYKQVVLFGVRRTRRERDQLRDSQVGRARHLLGQMSRGWQQLPPLPDHPDAEYAIPAVGPAHLVYRGLPLDEIEELLPKSGAYRQAARILCPAPTQAAGRPLTPLHAGHVAILAVSSMLDGVFGSGEDRHVAAWRTVKVIDRSEEVEPDGTIIQRERERFTNELTLLYASGKTAILH